MKRCSNCDYEMLPDKTICPNCGAAIGEFQAWPPAPANQFVPPPVNIGRLITGKRWGDLLLGFAFTWAVTLVYGIGLIVMPIVYLTSFDRLPTFKRGIGFGILGVAAVLLGAFCICTFQLFNMRR